MDASQALRECVEGSGLTHRQIARRLNRYDSYVSQVLTRSSAPGADTIAAIARACGYRLQLVPLDGGEAITIGDQGDDQSGDAPTIDQARALLDRASAILARLDDAGR